MGSEPFFEESACVQHGQLAGSSSLQVFKHMFSTVSLQICLYSVLMRQSVCMSSDRWGQEVPTIFRHV